MVDYQYTTVYPKHCWHDIGSQLDPEKKCCFCGVPQIEFTTGKHGDALGIRFTTRIDHQNEICEQQAGKRVYYCFKGWNPNCKNHVDRAGEECWKCKGDRSDDYYNQPG